MSDEIIADTFHHVIQCDATGCTHKVRSVTVTRRVNRFGLQSEHENQRMAEGWRKFVSRGHRWYCPLHGPSVGSKAYEVTR